MIDFKKCSKGEYRTDKSFIFISKETCESFRKFEYWPRFLIRFTIFLNKYHPWRLTVFLYTNLNTEHRTLLALSKVKIISRLWGEDHDFNMEEVLKELAYFKGITYYTSQFCGLENALPDCVKTNITYYANMVR